MVAAGFKEGLWDQDSTDIRDVGTSHGGRSRWQPCHQWQQVCGCHAPWATKQWWLWCHYGSL